LTFVIFLCITGIAGAAYFYNGFWKATEKPLEPVKPTADDDFICDYPTDPEKENVISNQLIAAQSFESLKVDITSFLENGCKKTANLGLDCTPLELKKKFDIRGVKEVPGALGGLKPALPIIEGRLDYYRPDGSVNKGIRMIGCRAPKVIQYVVYTKGEQRVIDSEESFISYFAPVDSEAEALGFAVALTGSYPLHKIEIPKKMVVSEPKTPATFVRKDGNDYIVHLFGFDTCGCGPHWNYSIEYRVTKEGRVHEKSRKNFYRDPDEDGLCVD
jgi:hypothetical protein